MAAAAGDAARNVIAKERDPLLMTLFDGALRASEGLQLTPNSLHSNGAGWTARVTGNCNKYRGGAVHVPGGPAAPVLLQLADRTE